MLEDFREETSKIKPVKTSKDELENICELLNYPYEIVVSERRNRTLTHIRAVLSRYLKERYNLTYEQIGELVGRHHSSVVHYFNHYEHNMNYQDFRFWHEKVKEITDGNEYNL